MAALSLLLPERTDFYFIGRRASELPRYVLATPWRVFLVMVSTIV
jgi:hypothetical protein